MTSNYPVFMSPEHVALMNEALETNADVRAACAALPRAMRMGYCLHDGPEGAPVYWTVSFSDTMRFSLDQQPCDVLFTGDWRKMMTASKAGQSGEVVDPELVSSGDESLIEPLGVVLASAVDAAVPCTFPDL